MSVFFLFVRSLRPKQWTKNLFIFASLVFTGRLHQPGSVAAAGAAFALFSLFSGSLYVINDIRDRDGDRLHPVKSRRPVASGALPVGTAFALAATLGAASLIASFCLARGFGLAVLAYGVLMLLYSGVLKRLMFIDVIVISIGFALRVAAGAFVLGETPTHWSLICVFFLTLFLGFSKRKADLLVQQRQSQGAFVLAGYDGDLLRMLLTLTASCTILAYCFFTLTSGKDIRLVYTLPFVVYGILQYLHLIMTPDLADRPDELFWRDAPLLINNGLWICACALILYVFQP
ncbi:MAG: decaprenyl-phosphate phosphoribosyltransferase [Elusimicrobia bacterium]|nr:decaprenyl-phosphate phosphoribosyltransferase [Elusimicrobiota bacterium]